MYEAEKKIILFLCKVMIKNAGIKYVNYLTINLRVSVDSASRILMI